MNNFTSEHQANIIRDDRDILWRSTGPSRTAGPFPSREPMPASATVCPAVDLLRFSCKSVPGGISLPFTCHGIPAKAFQVSFSAFHLPRNSCKSVPGVIFCLPPGTEFPRKCSRCLSLPSTCYGITTKVCQVTLFCRPPGTTSMPMFWRQAVT